MINIQAKPTTFNGIRFRSRLEARWAVFFDYLNIKYLYEPEWDAVKGGWCYVNYKPDFFLPQPFDLWVEIKPKHINKLSYMEQIKAKGWTIAYGSILVLVGEPQVPKTNSQEHYHLTARNGKLCLDDHMWWCECPECGRLDIGPYGKIPAACYTTCYPEAESDLFGNNLPEPDGQKSQRIKNACRAARYENFNIEAA